MTKPTADDYERALFEIAIHADAHAHQSIARDLLRRSDAWDRLVEERRERALPGGARGPEPRGAAGADRGGSRG